MSSPDLWTRVKQARLVQVLVGYLAVSWVLLQVVDILQESLELPAWLQPVTLILLVVGLVIILATAWVQSHPLTAQREQAQEVPGTWDVAPKELGESIARGKMPHLTWGRALVGGGFVFALLFGFAGLYVLIKDRGQSLTPSEAVAANEAAPGIAVLPFAVSGSELQEWREGMVNLLSTNLDGAGGLRAIDSRTVLARWDEVVGDAARADQADNLRVARASEARYALLGSAVAIGGDVRLTADIYDVESGERLGQGQVQGSPDSVFALVDGLSIEALRLVLARAGGDLPEVKLASLTTTSVPALKAFLEGEAHFRRAEFEPAIEAYDRAVGADSTFAQAYYQLGTAHGWTENAASPLAVRGLSRALELADRLPERQAQLLRASVDLYAGRLSGLEGAKEAVRQYPDDAEAWYTLGEAYYHLGPRALGSREEADGAFGRAVELNPRFAPYRIHGLELAFATRDSTLAAQRIAEYERLVPEDRFLLRARAAFSLAYGDSVTLQATRASLDTIDLFVLQQVYQLTQGKLDARSWWVGEELLGALGRRGAGSPFDDLLMTGLSFNRGHVGKALGRLDASGTAPGIRACGYVGLYRELRVEDPSVSEARVREALAAALDTTEALETTDPVTNPSLVLTAVCAGVHAADQGRWDDHTALLSRFERLADRVEAVWNSTAARDSTAARGPMAVRDSTVAAQMRSTARSLRGYGLWKRGQPREALPWLEVGSGVSFIGPDMIGDLHAELGDLKEAERYYRADWTTPWVRLKLAKLYERMGEPAKARAAYQYFVESWYDADPELQPVVEEARQAIARLMDTGG